MLKAPFRLRSEKDFNFVYKRGKGERAGYFFIKYAPTGKALSRFGFVVSKKSCASPVKRNRIKRRLREIIREEMKHIKPGYDIVISARSCCEGISQELIKNSLKRALNKTGISYEENSAKND